jgi:putative spermidine/putrescine transport system permease protein
MSLVKIVLAVYVALFIFVLYGPFFVMAILSFQGEHGGPTFPLQGASFFWYERLFDPLGTARDIGEFVGNFGAAVTRSLILALLTMCISTVLATMAAQAFRTRFVGAGPIFYLYLLGIIIPGVTVGLGHALFWQALDIDKHWFTTTLIAHILWTFPFCFIVMLTIFNRFDHSTEEAAMCLGASSWRTFWHVTLPIMKPGIMASGLFGFTLSFDEFARTVLVNGSQNTLPLDVLGMATIRIEPRLFVMGVLITVISLVVIAVFAVLMTLDRYRPRFAGQEEHRA